MVDTSSFTVCKACSAFNPPSSNTCHRCEAPLTHIQRRFDRVEVHILGTASLPTGGTHEIEIRNIGMGGLMFYSDRPFQPEEILRIQLPLSGDCFIVEAEVRHVREETDSYFVGVEFAVTSPPFIFRVHELLKESAAPRPAG